MHNEIIKYFDFFGTKYNFYTEGRPKFYTILGGILSIISIIICLVVFFFITSDDILRKTPTVTTSLIPSEGYHKIKFGKEKIWLPWRIVDYNNIYINHTGLIYPIIYYFYGKRKNITDGFDFQYKILEYKLCNETSMVEKTEIYQIDVPLDQLYCIDMDDLEMGGSWISNFINYVRMDLYLCENGTDYNENNPYCTTLDTIKNKLGENNSIDIEIFYPVVQFQPTNIKIPIIILYRQYFYHISNFSNRIDRLFLQEYILMDNLGWITNKIKNSTYWGFSQLNGESYSTSNNKDLVKEASTSRTYSLNLYLEPGVVVYSRKYKKVLLLITEGLPMMLAVFSIFKKISKIFKFAEEEKKMFELLFESLKEKKDKFKENLLIKMSSQDKLKQNYANRSINRSVNRLLFPQNSDLNNRKIYSNKNEPKMNEDEEEGNNAIKIINNNFKIYSSNKKVNGSNKKFLNNISKDKFNFKIFENKKYEKLQLFPYRYYLSTSFIKNLDIRKLIICFPKKFTKVYLFLSKMFDVSSYLILQKEFQILKNTALKGEDVNIIEKASKINVNAVSFMRNMNECIDKGKFKIFSHNINKKEKNIEKYKKIQFSK